MTEQGTSARTQLDEKASMLYHCADCNYCVDAVWPDRHLNHVCPTLAHHSPALSYSGRGYMSLARAIYEGEEFALDDVADRVFTCTGCGNCERVCPIGLSPLEVNLSLRELLVDNNAVPSALIKRRDSLISGRTPRDQDVSSIAMQDSRGEEIPPPLPIESTLDLVDVLFLPGCDAGSDTPTEALHCLQIIQTIKPSVGVLGEKDKCCGAALKELGFAQDGQVSHHALMGEISVYPHLTSIIHMTPKCQQQLVGDPRVVSFPQWLAGLVEHNEVTVTSKSDLPKVRYMNTCAAGTWNSEVLRLLKVCGLKISNADAGAPLTMCCGAGGGMPVIAPQSAIKMAKAYLQEFSDTGGTNTVTLVSDANCLGHLGGSTDAQGSQIFGLAGFLNTFLQFARTS